MLGKGIRLEDFLGWGAAGSGSIKFLRQRKDVGTAGRNADRDISNQGYSEGLGKIRDTGPLRKCNPLDKGKEEAAQLDLRAFPGRERSQPIHRGSG